MPLDSKKTVSPDLTTNCGGIISPNPFWLASAPPANSGDQVQRAFDAGWGGAVWKTLGSPIQNVSSRFAALEFRGTKAIGFNNIELITDRPLDVNFREIYETKLKFPKHALFANAVGLSTVLFAPGAEGSDLTTDFRVPGVAAPELGSEDRARK